MNRKIIAASLILLFVPCQFILGQDSLIKQNTVLIKYKSPHTFSSTSLVEDTASSGIEKQVCKSCHVPESNNPFVMDSSVINIKQSKTFFQMTGNYLFSYCPMCTKVNVPNGISSSCLSCHDGSVAQDRVARQPGIKLGSGTNNLFNSHPVSFIYDTLLNAELWPVTHVYNGTNTVKDLLDENNEVQCTSCHNMHNNEYEFFLKVSNEKSALCLVCHKR